MAKIAIYYYDFILIYCFIVVYVSKLYASITIAKILLLSNILDLIVLSWLRLKFDLLFLQYIIMIVNLNNGMEDLMSSNQVNIHHCSFIH